MKKLKYLLIFLLLSFSIFASEAYVASFNALRLGNAKKDYKLTAKILSNFDLIGLMEVMNENGVKRLVSELERRTHKKWDYHISEYPVGKTKYKEYFAYVWKKDKVKYLGNSRFYPNKGNIFSRPPYASDFKIDNMDFTFILNHLIFGKSEKERRREAFNLKKVYRYFQDLDKKENDIIIAGDFNLSAFDESFEGLLKEDNMTYTLDPNIKTTLGANRLASSYDNMFLSKKYTKEFEGKSGALDFTKEKYKTMKKKVSDHLPIFIILNTTYDDD